MLDGAAFLDLYQRGRTGNALTRPAAPAQGRMGVMRRKSQYKLEAGFESIRDLEEAG